MNTNKPNEVEKNSDEIIADRAKHLQIIKNGFGGNPNPVQLPLWEESLRGIPNEIVRCSLFNARNRAIKRRYFEDEPMFVIGETKVHYRGEELRQDDEIVWMQVLHLARIHLLNELVKFVPASFMKALGWKSRGQENYERLRKILSRLQATAVSFSVKRSDSSVSVSLIRRFECHDLGKWQVWIEPEMKILFPEDYYSLIKWQQRLDLPSGIASKLHSYYASHKEPYPIRVENVKNLCGSTGSLDDFREKMLEALEHLKAIQFLNQYWIDQNDLLHVKRTH